VICHYVGRHDMCWQGMTWQRKNSQHFVWGDKEWPTGTGERDEAEDEDEDAASGGGGRERRRGVRFESKQTHERDGS
jgi:hypothetical protein